MRGPSNIIPITAALIIACILLQSQWFRAEAYEPSVYWLDSYTTLESFSQSQWNLSDVRFETSRVPQGDGSLATWMDGTYSLPAYLYMYLWNGDPTYIDRFLQRSYQMIGFEGDTNGDGQSGWTSARYSNSLILNSGFETSEAWSGFNTRAVRQTHFSTTSSLFLYPIMAGCENLLPKENQGMYYLRLFSGASINQSVQLLPDRQKYQLWLNASIPDAMQLEIRIVVNGQTVYQEAISRLNPGPQGWQQFLASINLTNISEAILSVKVLGGANNQYISLDNIKLTSYEEMLSFDLAMAQNFAHFAVMVDRIPALSPYSADAQMLQNEAERLVTKWQPWFRETGDGRGLYLFPDDNSVESILQGQAQPYNMQAFAGLALHWLSQLEDGQPPAIDYQSQAVQVARWVASAFRPDPAAPGNLIWNYLDPWPPSESFPVHLEDISHAKIETWFINEMYQSSQVFDYSVIHGLAQTYTSLWNGDEIKPAFALLVDGSGTMPANWTTPFVQHIFITPGSEFRSAAEAGWRYSQPAITCRIQSNIGGQQQYILVPALMLYRYETFNDRPVLVDDQVTLDENSGTHVLDVLANDFDPNMDALNITSATQGKKGWVEVSGNEILYTPNIDMNGTDSFTYTVSDSRGGISSAAVTVTIKGFVVLIPLIQANR